MKYLIDPESNGCLKKLKLLKVGKGCLNLSFFLWFTHWWNRFCETDWLGVGKDIKNCRFWDDIVYGRPLREIYFELHVWRKTLSINVYFEFWRVIFCTAFLRSGLLSTSSLLHKYFFDVKVWNCCSAICCVGTFW